MKYNHARFLLVDDEPSHRLILKEIIKELWAFQGDILEAATGQEAILMYQQWQPQLILMDLKMPGMNGFEVIHQIRLLEETRDCETFSVDVMQTPTQIIAVSALAMESDRTQAFAAGCNGFIKKPYSLHELLETLNFHYFYKVPLLSRSQTRVWGAQTTSQNLKNSGTRSAMHPLSLGFQAYLQSTVTE